MGNRCARWNPPIGAAKRRREGYHLMQLQHRAMRPRDARKEDPMCLAVPGKVISIGDDARAVVDMLGAQREVSLRLVPDAHIGDYVLVHAGFGIQVVDPEEAQETIRLVQDLAELVDGELPADEVDSSGTVDPGSPAACGSPALSTGIPA